MHDSQLTEPYHKRWDKSTRDSHPFWFAVGPHYVIGMVELVANRVYSIKTVGPNGLGVAVEVGNYTLDEAVRDAEITLRDLGWKTTDEGFTL